MHLTTEKQQTLERRKLMKKSLCILCSTATALSLAACGTAQVSAGEAAETTTVSTEELTTVTGKVTEIEGTNITLALGEVSENSEENTAPEMPSGNAPDDATGNDENGMQTPPEMSSRISFTENRETLTVDISEAAITLNDQTLSADDIYVDDILELTVDSSNTAAIRSDRGGGTVNVDGGTYTSNGYNSPAVYSTAAITVKNATLTANNSEALVIEGQNSIALENCDVTGNMSDTKGSCSEENVQNVMIYQSMSDDAEVGTSVFSMKGGTLTSQNGDMFYITNTHCTMTLSGVTLKNLDSDSAFLRVVGNSASHGWGTAGSNGAQVEFTADSQTIDGNIVVDTISTLDFSLTNGSVLNGTINIVDNGEGGSAVSDNAVVTIDSGSTWNLTGNCTITSLTNNGTINFNGYTITHADGTVLK